MRNDTVAKGKFILLVSTTEVYLTISDTNICEHNPLYNMFTLYG